MADAMIDVRDLPEEEVRTIQKIVELLRRKKERPIKESEFDNMKQVESIKFAKWPLGATGTMSRREIYDNL